MSEQKKIYDLSGPDGNAFAMMAAAQRMAKQLGRDSEAILEDMQSGDYEHLVEVFEREFGEFFEIVR